MIVVNAKMQTNKENFQIIKTAVKKLEIKTRQENGCIDYGFSVELHNKSVIRITELWEDLKSLKDHLKTKHIEIFLSEIPRNIFELASILTIFFAMLFFFSSGGAFVDVIPFLGFLVLAIARMIPSLTRISNSFQNFRFAEPAMKVLNDEIIFNDEKKFFNPSKKLSNKL